MSEKLKPCPFCGNKPELTYDTAAEVACYNDKCCGYEAFYRLDQWNHRHTDAALDDILKHMREFMNESLGRVWSDNTKLSNVMNHYAIVFNKLKKLREGE